MPTDLAFQTLSQSEDGSPIDSELLNKHAFVVEKVMKEREEQV